MPVAKMDIALNDFSAGEVDPDVKRMNAAIAMTGGRAMSNWRVLNSRKLSNRPGRTALFMESGRVEKLLMSPGNLFYLAFGNGYLRVYNAAGSEVFQTPLRADGSGIPWTGATVKNIVFAQYKQTIYIFYADAAPDNVPQVLTWDGISQTSAWTLSTFTLSTYYNYQVRTPFYRISPQSVFLWPSAQTGNITLTASAAIFNASMVGTRINFAYQQILITGYTDPTHVSATVAFILPQVTSINWTGGAYGPTNFSVGQIVEGTVSAAKGVIVAIDSTHIYVLNLTEAYFVSTDIVTSVTAQTNGTLTLAAVAYNSVTTSGISIWDDEVMNNYRGWPTSGFIDQGRLGLCNFPAVPSLICWSAIGLFTDQYTDPNNASPDNAVQEIVPGNSHVLYVVPGMESSEFVFCDNAIYYIPITAQTPLVPGSVSFIGLSASGIASVQPRAAEQSIVFVKAGGASIAAVQAPGAYFRPYVVDNISDNHSHLFTASTPIAIAIPTSSQAFEELYMYVLLANGTIVIGKYSMREGLLDAGEEGKPKVGWLPWSGVGTTTWLCALGTDLTFTTTYAPNGVTPVGVVEALDTAQYLDAAISVNSLPAPFTPPAGKGPLYYFPGPNSSVTLLDLGTRQMGTYQVDADGNIIPQNIAGENLKSSQLVAGQTWSAIYEPFIPHAPAGSDSKQRMRRRKVCQAAVSVQNSTGFTFDGARIPTYFQGDDPAQAPTLREDTYKFHPTGLSYDPRKQLIKDTAGPLVIVEVTLEATV